MTTSKSQKGTLAIVGALFILSAGFRVMTEAGQVFADEPAGPVAQAESDGMDPIDLARPEFMEPALKAIREREARLVELEKEMNDRQKSVEAAEDAIRKELQNLKTAEDSLRATITLASEAAENDLAQLTDVYSNMKPKNAAALFEKMEASFAAGFLYRMAPDAAARVMAGMSPEKAYLVSVELAGRNADIPLE